MISVYDSDGYTFWCFGQPESIGNQEMLDLKGYDWPKPNGVDAHIMHDQYKDYIWGFSYKLGYYFYLEDRNLSVEENINKAISEMIDLHR